MLVGATSALPLEIGSSGERLGPEKADTMEVYDFKLGSKLFLNV